MCAVSVVDNSSADALYERIAARIKECDNTDDLKGRYKVARVSDEQIEIQWDLYQNDCYKVVSDIIAGHIVEHYGKDMVLKEINVIAPDLQKEDVDSMLEYAKKQMKNYYNSYVSKVSKDVKRVLKETKHLNIQGLIQFRLKRYKESISSLAGESLDNLLLEHSNSNVVDTYRSILDVRGVGKYEELNVIYNEKEEAFRFYDKDGHDVTEKAFIIYDSYTVAALGDAMLLLALVTAAPQKVVLHNVSMWPSIETIQLIEVVFKDREVIQKRY